MARGQRKGFKHTEETKQRISAASKGKQGGGFNVRVECDLCHKEMNAANLARHRPQCLKYNGEHKKFKRMRRIAKVYGLSLDQYIVMRDLQKGKCYICGRPENEQKRALSIDHCHTTQKVRKLLCDRCNHLIGNAKDDVRVLQAAISYIEEHK